MHDMIFNGARIMMEGATSTIDVSGVDPMSIMNDAKALVPWALPAVIGFIAFRKGIAFLKGMLKGA